MDNNRPIESITELDIYQSEAEKTAVFPEHLGPLYTVMGVLGEAGEMGQVVLDVIERASDDDPSFFTRDVHIIRDAIERVVESARTVEVYKKRARKGQFLVPPLPELTQEEKDRFLSEGGDGLWYAAMTATVCGHRLAQVAQANVKKLRDRKSAGVLASQGETIEERLEAERQDDYNKG